MLLMDTALFWVFLPPSALRMRGNLAFVSKYGLLLLAWLYLQREASYLLINLLVLRRRVSAKRRTIVFSTVRPSLQQIIELSKKFQVFYTFNGIIRPMNHVRLSVCPSVRLSVCPSVRLSTPRCTTLYGRVLAYPSMDFVFLWHMEQSYIGAVLRRIIFEKSQKL